jgi:hypothetical protein
MTSTDKIMIHQATEKEDEDEEEASEEIEEEEGTSMTVKEIMEKTIQIIPKKIIYL